MIKFTIATVCYNAASTIERTLRSVAAQDYPHVEHLIVDGASRDATLSLVAQFAEHATHSQVVHSAPDRGLYDAMNTALRLATGHYILFLNAGDCFHSPNTLSQMAAPLSEAALPAVLYGHTALVDEQGIFLRMRRLAPPSHLTARSFLNGMLVCHQAFAARCDLARATPYDLRYRLSADYDWCIRLMKQAEATGQTFHNTQLTIADYLAEGMTTRHHRASLLERLRIMAHHYGWWRAIAQHLWFVVRAIIKR